MRITCSVTPTGTCPLLLLLPLLALLLPSPLALLPASFATRRLIDAAFAQAGVTPLVRVEMESVDALLQACRSGPLATIAAEHAALQVREARRRPRGRRLD